MEIPTAPVNESLEAIEKLKVGELKKILRDRGQPVTGKKRMQKTSTNGLPEQENVPFLPVTSCKKSADIT
ncbi:hypothetical protein P5673_025163 [Acropora cervicornis]|uniref:SAP domain-containing protein n=1 Tax=Acropora cervicornis TaxID=6130 RepID=A0AAD9UXP2_ACRCE|nr:hypothetical protein P5673_025163 [Acropora cervicornis]